MNIALFTDNFYPELGGIQDSVAALGRELGRRGHRVDFVVPRASAHDFEVVKLPVKEIDLGPNVHIHRVFSLPYPSPTQQSRVVIPTLLRWRAVRTYMPDVLHTHGFFGLGLEALFTSRMLDVPIVGTNHWAISEFARYIPLTTNWVAKKSLQFVTWYFNHCDYVTAPSRSVLTEMEEIGLTSPHGAVSNPIDTQVFTRVAKTKRQELRKKFGLSGITVVSAGRLGAEKKIDVTIRAIALVKESIPDIAFAVAGHGSEEEVLKRLARSLGIESKVRFMGTLAQRDLAQLYQASDMFVITSTSETQSMVLLQAMACGLPTIGARWRALPEYINGANGFLVEPDNHHELAEKISHLAKNREMRTSLGEGGYAFVQQYSVSAIGETWEKVYESAKNRYTPSAVKT